MKTGPGDVRLMILIAGDELHELKRFTIDMVEAFGLDRRIEAYSGKRPIGFYRWDLVCPSATIDRVLKDERYIGRPRLCAHSALSEAARWEVIVQTAGVNNKCRAYNGPNIFAHPTTEV